MCIDETGTAFTRDYPNFESGVINFSGLHTKNTQIYEYVKTNIEDESNNVFVLASNFVQVEAIDHPFVEIDDAFGIERNGAEKLMVDNTAVGGANYHPNNIGHQSIGFSLYAFLKWLISK